MPRSSNRAEYAQGSQSLWNELVGPEELPCIPDGRLPTNREVMQRYGTIKNVLASNASIRSIAHQIYTGNYNTAKWFPSLRRFLS